MNQTSIDNCLYTPLSGTQTVPSGTILRRPGINLVFILRTKQLHRILLSFVFYQATTGCSAQNLMSYAPRFIENTPFLRSRDVGIRYELEVTYLHS